MERERIDISYRTIVFTVFFILGLWVLYLLRNVLLVWFIAFILMTALNPFVSYLEKLKIPRFLGILAAFLLSIGAISLIFAGIIPTLFEQLTYLGKNLSVQIPNSPFLHFDLNFLTSQLELISKNALNLLKIALGAASNILAVFSLVVFTFYLLMERRNLPTYLRSLFGRGDGEARSIELIDNIENKLGGWVRGELALMFIVGLLSYLGLLLLHIPYSLPLALLAGLMELIPNIGPTISAIPAIIVGWTISPALAGAALVLYVVVQQLENNLIVPMVMRGAVGIKPLITLMALMVGVTLGGVAGAVLAVPLYITIETIIKHIFKYRDVSN